MKYGFFVVAVLLGVAGQVSAAGLEISEAQSNRVHGADLKLLADGRLVAQAARQDKPQVSAFEIAESENCDWRKVSETEIQLGQRCEFLSGSYRYVTQEAGAPRRLVIVGFSVSRPHSAERIFIVNAPLEATEKLR